MDKGLFEGGGGTTTGDEEQVKPFIELDEVK